MNPLLSAILGVGHVLDTPRAMVFAAAQGDNPLTAMLHPERRRYGAEVTGNPLTGFLLDAVADPLTYLGVGLVGALRAKAKAINARRAEMLARRFMPEEIAKRTVIKQAIPRFRDKGEWAKALRREMVAAGYPSAAGLSDDSIIANFYDATGSWAPEDPALFQRLLARTYRQGSAPARMYHGTPIAYDWPSSTETAQRSYHRMPGGSLHPAQHFVTADPEYASTYAQLGAERIRQAALYDEPVRTLVHSIQRRERKAIRSYRQAVESAYDLLEKAGLPLKVPPWPEILNSGQPVASSYLNEMSALAARRGDAATAAALARAAKRVQSREYRLWPAVRLRQAVDAGLEDWATTGKVAETAPEVVRGIIRRAQVPERLAPNVRMYYVDVRKPIDPNAWIDLVKEHGNAEKALAAARAMGYDALADIPTVPAAGFEVMPFSVDQFYAPYLAPRARHVPGAGTLAATLAGYHLPLGGFRRWKAQ